MNEIEARNLVLPTIEGCTITKVEDHGDLYCVYFVNAEYFESGNIEDFKIGCGPSFVEKLTKKIFPTGSGQSVEFSLRAYKETGSVYAKPTNALLLRGLESHTKNSAIMAIKSVLCVNLIEAKSIYETLDSGSSIKCNFQSDNGAEKAIETLKEAGVTAKVDWK
jgi:ribosomal protein L7/L12